MRETCKPRKVEQAGSVVQLRAAQSLDGFLKIIEDISPSTQAGLWFRGQSDASYRLEPGVLRDTTQITDGYYRPITENQVVNASGGEVIGISSERMLDEFKRQARPFLEWVPTNDFEWMFIAQHHGLPTRLLDWSTNALVALFFAASNAVERDGDGKALCKNFLEGAGHEFSDNGFAVFVIDPGAINLSFHDIADPIDIAAYSEKWEHYLNPTEKGLKSYAPICVLAPHIASRIRAQSGVFTLHGSCIYPLDYYDVIRPHITKIFLPFTSTKSIKRSLKMIGITYGSIYPSLDTIARDITEGEKLRYSAEKEKYFSSVTTK